MTIICSWCRGEGQTGVVGEKAPLDDRRETHGICITHRLAVKERWNQFLRDATQAGQPLVSFASKGDPSGPAADGQLAVRPSPLWISIKNLTRKAGF